MDTAVLAVRTILSLAVVLGLIWYAGRRLNDSTSGRGGDGAVMTWLRRVTGHDGAAGAGPTPRAGRSARRGARPTPVLTMVGRQAVGPKSSVAVVDVGGQRLVLGVSESGISLLTSMDAPEPEVVTEVAPEVVAEVLEVGAAPAEPEAPSTRREPVPVAASFDSELVAASVRAGALDNSILSPSTWRQALTAMQGRTVRR